MFGRWEKKEHHRANKQQGDPAALDREGGAPQEEATPDERREQNR